MLNVDGKEIEGQCNVDCIVDRSVHPNVIRISGLIKTEEFIPDEIEELRAGRFVVRRVTIVGEHLASEEDFIVYDFIGDEYDIY